MTPEQRNEIYHFYLRYWWDHGRIPRRDYLARRYGLPTAEIDAARDAMIQSDHLKHYNGAVWPTVLGIIRHQGITYALTPP